MKVHFPVKIELGQKVGRAASLTYQGKRSAGQPQTNIGGRQLKLLCVANCHWPLAMAQLIGIAYELL